MNVTQPLNRLMGERMAASGRMAMIAVNGRRSGKAIRTPVGYVRHADGRVWLGAGRAESQWPRNLLANPRCRLLIGGAELSYAAEELLGLERVGAVFAIHAKYGAPASRVGIGPVFVLRPIDVSQVDEEGKEGDGAAA